MAGTAITLSSAWAQAQPAPALPTLPDSSFTLTQVQFSPTTAVHQDDLQAAVRHLVGTQIMSGDLVQVSNLVRQLYEARGFGLVGIGYLSQDLEGGVLKVTIVEPRTTRLVIDSTGPAPVTEARVSTVLTHAGVESGKALNLHAVDRALYTLNDWPGVKAKATLTPGADDGSYTVAVQTEKRRAWDASIDLDNHGSSVSGRYRAGALLRWNNPLGIGDNLDLRVASSNGGGNTVGRLGYEMPVGATPWRVGAGLSRVAYELSENFAGALGHATVFDTSLSYPIVRTRETNWVARLGYENKDLTDEFGIRTDKRLKVLSGNLTFESRDGLGGGGFSGGTVGVQLGELENAPDLDATTTGNFSKFSAQITRLQTLTQKLSLFVGLSGQAANRNLDTAEKFTLGGVKGVRAYPSAEAASDMGALMNTELRLWVNPQWSTFAFHDAARGRLRKTPTSADVNRRILRGSGIGLQYTHPQIMTVKATLGQRGSEPVVSDPDKGRTLLLVQVQHSF